ncbi:hypothetical protein CFOL_v3_23642 [Cephalotus follicularis]|uniref:Reverse transcriptase domain-containing protein n=1 Tax=Cephalotus follicularis TaxID=3775 RepID=A0A1Q3CJD5_CEPFO|nr:hypothetical protein CFOL_v3_23642 [Cephalotus follicularis]
MTNQPLKQILQKPDMFGRLVKWAIELGEFDIEYKTRLVVKAQVLADFVAELTSSLTTGEENRTESPLTQSTKEDGHKKLYVDESSNSKGSGARFMLINPEGDTFKYALKFDFPASNNPAEYKSVLIGL